MCGNDNISQMSRKVNSAFSALSDQRKPFKSNSSLQTFNLSAGHQ